ncbi:stalk domain-containing protein [Paenibacillus sp. 2TAF8]
MDTPSILQNNRILVPVRFISERLGMKVDWEFNECIG